MIAVANGHDLYEYVRGGEHENFKGQNKILQVLMRLVYEIEFDKANITDDVKALTFTGNKTSADDCPAYRSVSVQNFPGVADYLQAKYKDVFMMRHICAIGKI